jgi:hypothetical protein
MAVFWVVAPFILVEVCRRFRGIFCLQYQGDGVLVALKMETASTSETSVNLSQTTQRNNPEVSHFHISHCEERKSPKELDVLFLRPSVRRSSVYQELRLI